MTSSVSEGSSAMNHLDYDSADEDLTVLVESENGASFCECTVNSMLLKMMSPWWKTKLTPSGFKDHVREDACTIVYESPSVAECALNAARLRTTKADLVATDLGFVFQVWQLADMWQFTYLTSLCDSALQDLLTDTDAETLQSFVTTALEHSDAMMEDVLIPFFISHPTQRSADLYLAFDDKAMLKLAQMAPIAGFQARSSFANRLASHAERCADDELVQYMEQNPEARSPALYRQQTLERCIVLFAKAPLAFVKHMVELVLTSTWSTEQRDFALMAIDFGRVTSFDLKYLKGVHERLPQQAYIFKHLWMCSQRLHKNEYLSTSLSAPWAVACAKDCFCDTRTVSVGPIQVSIRGTRNATFEGAPTAYGLLGCSDNPRVVRPGRSFTFSYGQVLVIYDASNAAFLGS